VPGIRRKRILIPTSAGKEFNEMSLPSILIVDDNRDLADGLAMLLEDEEYEVTVAYSGEDAVAESRKHAYDLVLMDFKLPKATGLDALAAMRQERPETQALIMTGFHVEQLVAEIVEQGAMRILHEPVSTERLLETLETMGSTGVILVIDDDPTVAERLEQMLRATGRHVLLGRSPSQVEDGARRGAMNTLLLDLGAPLTQSLEALLKLKSYNQPVLTVIVVHPAAGATRSQDALRSREVTGCFFKPFDPDELLDAVGQICSGSQNAADQRP
jgi:DNA-binding NtrC family response regulator